MECAFQGVPQCGQRLDGGGLRKGFHRILEELLRIVRAWIRQMVGTADLPLAKELSNV